MESGGKRVNGRRYQRASTWMDGIVPSVGQLLIIFERGEMCIEFLFFFLLSSSTTTQIRVNNLGRMELLDHLPFSSILSYSILFISSYPIRCMYRYLLQPFQFQLLFSFFLVSLKRKKQTDIAPMQSSPIERPV